jgi:hypothetical protein
MKKLARSKTVRPLDEEPVVNPVEEIRRIWATRLRIATAKRREIEGAQALVEALDRLAPEHGVEQMSLEDGAELGTIYFDAETQEPLGAILHRRTAEDAPRPLANYEFARGRGADVTAKEAVVPPSRRARAVAR